MGERYTVQDRSDYILHRGWGLIDNEGDERNNIVGVFGGQLLAEKVAHLLNNQSDDVRFLLDGLGVESLQELHHLVEVGRSVIGTLAENPLAGVPLS